MTVTIPLAGAFHITVPDGLADAEALAAAYKALEEADPQMGFSNDAAADGGIDCEYETYEKMSTGNCRHYPHGEIEFIR